MFSLSFLHERNDLAAVCFLVKLYQRLSERIAVFGSVVGYEKPLEVEVALNRVIHSPAGYIKESQRRFGVASAVFHDKIHGIIIGLLTRKRNARGVSETQNALHQPFVRGIGKVFFEALFLVKNALRDFRRVTGVSVFRDPHLTHRSLFRVGLCDLHGRRLKSAVFPHADELVQSVGAVFAVCGVAVPPQRLGKLAVLLVKNTEAVSDSAAAERHFDRDSDNIADNVFISFAVIEIAPENLGNRRSVTEVCFGQQHAHGYIAVRSSASHFFFAEQRHGFLFLRRVAAFGDIAQEAPALFSFDRSYFPRNQACSDCERHSGIAVVELHQTVEGHLHILVIDVHLHTPPFTCK